MRRKLVADGRPDKVRSVGVEALLHEQVYLPQIHKPQIDRDLLRLAHANTPLSVTVYYHPYTIYLDGNTQARTLVK